MIIIKIPEYILSDTKRNFINYDNRSFEVSFLKSLHLKKFFSIKDFLREKIDIPEDFVFDYIPENDEKKEFFYRIKTPALNERETWNYKPFSIGYIWAKTTAEARDLLEQKYNIELSMRALKKNIGTKDFFLLQLFERDYSFDKFWHSKRQCKNCSITYTKFEKDTCYAFSYDSKEDFCSIECQNEYNLKLTKHDLLKYDYDGVNKAVIYKITNKQNNKCYIGKTTQSFTYRWHQHLHKGTGSKFQEALNNTTLLDWSFEIIDILPFTGKDIDASDKNGYAKELALKEQSWIDFYDSINNGYNTLLATKDIENMEDILKGKDYNLTKNNSSYLSKNDSLFDDF